MNKNQFERLNKALGQDEIDLEAIKEIVREQALNNDISPMLQNFCNVMVLNDDEKLLAQAHKIRAIYRAIPAMYVYQSQQWLESYNAE